VDRLIALEALDSAAARELATPVCCGDGGHASSVLLIGGVIRDLDFGEDVG